MSTQLALFCDLYLYFGRPFANFKTFDKISHTIMMMETLNFPFSKIELQSIFFFFFFEQIILGKKVFHETKLDQELVEELVTLGKDLPFDVVSGKTVCTDDFYEGSS